jgi:hypothetical protein
VSEERHLIEPIPLPETWFRIKRNLLGDWRKAMKDFSNASFPPDTIGIMKNALDAAVASLPDPVSSAHVQSIAETILRTAREGERDPLTLQIIALMELQITPRH